MTVENSSVTPEDLLALASSYSYGLNQQQSLVDQLNEMQFLQSVDQMRQQRTGLDENGHLSPQALQNLQARGYLLQWMPEQQRDSIGLDKSQETV